MNNFIHQMLAAISFVLVSAGIQSGVLAQAKLEGPDRPFLGYAIQAANWIESLGTDSGDQTVWPVSATEPGRTDFNLYNGNSGIVLFWLQLHRATGEARYLDLAKRGANALVDHTNSLDEQSDPGYWTGYSGVAATLGEVWLATGDDKYLEGYRRCFDLLAKKAQPVENSIRNGIRFSPVTDIIAGSAGIGFFLLAAVRIQDDERALQLAVQTGDGLLDAAESVDLDNGVAGLRWMMDPDFPREMPNYSHGTAGICDYLLALDARLKEESGTEAGRDYDRRFQEAAVAGARYLASIAELNDGKCLIIHHRQKDTSVSEQDPLYYLGWCHGPGGTGRMFVSLARSLPDQKEWNGYAIRNGDSLLSSGIPTSRLPGFWNNSGVCCGSSGVGAFVLDLYRVTGNPALKEFAVRLAMDTVERATRHALKNGRTGLSWIHAEHRARPDFVHAQTGLMQGAAGIGLWFLKLDAMLNNREFGFSIPVQPLQGWGDAGPVDRLGKSD